MPGEGVEIKYHMQKGAGMVYSWKANGTVAFEFHGEPDNKPNKDYFESYELNDKVGADHSSGSFTAPTTGIHGWFWENKGKKEVEIHLITAGFYDNAKMYGGRRASGSDDPRCQVKNMASPAFLQSNAIADLLNNTEWGFAVAECFHIVFFAVAIGTIMIVDLRLLGLAFPRTTSAKLTMTLGCIR